MMHTADFILRITVEFKDDGQHSLMDLAFEAMEGMLTAEMLGDTEIELSANSVRPVPK